MVLAGPRYNPATFEGRCVKSPPSDQESSFGMEVSGGTDRSTMVGQQGRYLWSGECTTVLGADGSPLITIDVLCISGGGLGLCLCG